MNRIIPSATTPTFPELGSLTNRKTFLRLQSCNATKLSHMGTNFAFLPFYWISYGGLFQLEQSHVCLQNIFL